MSTPLQEFSINLPMVSVSPVGAVEPAEVPAAIEPPPYDVTADVAVPEDVDTSACSHILAYVDTCTIGSYDPASPVVVVDMVLTVNITNPETGCTNIHKLVKRLAMDKCKLAIEAASNSPVQVVEALEDQEEVKREMTAFYSAKRAREMAGLSESKGDKKASVAFSFDADGDKPARNTGKVTIDSIKDKAHARHVFDSKHKSKYKNATITRVTMIEGEI